MRFKSFYFFGVFLLLLFITCKLPGPAASVQNNSRPNIIFILTDDMGYGDIGCFGAKDVRTPNLDQMANEGVRLTSFYATPVCSPSRAALLTGCYPERVGFPWVVGPKGPSWTEGRHNVGLNPAEETLPELLQKKGYVTGIIGKWHLGHLPENLPAHHGFDSFFGLPYSNDMWPYKAAHYSPLPVLDNGDTAAIIATPEDQTTLTKLFTQKALAFIRRHQSSPFFLYLAHPMPHVPIYASDGFRGKSANGLYGDVIEEIDWSVGEILKALKSRGLDKNTLVIFTSDNGPWLTYGDHAGSPAPFSNGKHTVFEGGVRVPFVARWPAVIPAGTSSEAITGLVDILPTIADMVKSELPVKKIDGKSLLPLLYHPRSDTSPREVQLYFFEESLQAIRRGNWKLHVAHDYLAVVEPGENGSPGKTKTQRIELSLYNLKEDPKEERNVAASHPALVQELSTLLSAYAKEMHKNKRPSHRAKNG